ncbi:MAG: endonuclease/exonuclease/phosphatase family protein [Planctomycetota bacterium]
MSTQHLAFTVLLVVLAIGGNACGEQHPIQVDGRDLDWGGVLPAHTDGAGDAGPSGLDFAGLSVADDARFLFLRLELGIESQLDEGNDLVLYLDTDMNSATGLPVRGIGAELEWRFGSRTGTFHVGGGSTLFHDDLRLRSGPTVSSSWFEVSIGRDTLPNGAQPLFSGTQVRLILRDEDGAGDELPNTGSVVYTMDQGTAVPPAPIPLGRQQASDLRIATYNVHNDSPWDPGEEPRFGRQFSAVDADIWCFQEIYNHTAAETASLVGTWVNAGSGAVWSAADNNDCIVVSRYAILGSWSLSGNLAVLVDTTAVLGQQLLLINAHLPCCSNETGRQDEVDEILAFVRDAKASGGPLTIAADTAIVVVGDLNLVGLSSTLTSLLTGDVADEATYGADVALDWDGTGLVNLVSSQTEKRMAYTWRNDNSSFWPGLLDFVIYSDSVVAPANHYVLYTPEMSSAVLSAAGLQAPDSEASDHLLRVADLRPQQPPPPKFVRGDCNSDLIRDISDPAYLLQVLFLGSSAPCQSACDTDDDGALTVADAVVSIQALFGLAPQPIAPFPLCATEPTPDLLTCTNSVCP